jgi:TolB-like protein/class 3 adenylate cyclase
MTEERARRKLSGILSADAVGYSRLMQADEASTIRTLQDSKRLMSELIEQFKGRVVDAPGDNLLAEFASIVDATECAVEIQRKLKSRNADLPENRRMKFRIGINLGDVVEEADRIYGDGVNIAARVETMAEPGGICISGAAYDHVENKLGLEYKNLGEHKVKNIAKPIRVYKIRIETEAPVSQVSTKLKLPDKPSIAVLPFTNMSDDPKQEYFSDGMAEDLMTDLSKISGLLVISRNSSFAYKGKSIEAKQIAEKLGARYLLEGSVRKAGEQVRINAQLIDAATDHHLWAERYDGKMDNIFALQDKITQKIVAALAVKLAKREQEHLASRETSNIAAYDAFLKGMDYLNRQSRTAKTLSYFEKAIKLDPDYSRAYAGLAIAYDDASWLNLFARLGLSFQETRLWMRHYLQLAMKNSTSFASVLNANIIYLERRYEEAIAEIGRAIALDPNDARSNWNMARALTAGGRPEEAIEYAKVAIRIDPGCVY